MPTIVSQRMSRLPTLAWTGSKHPVHTAQWIVEMDQAIPSDFAMAHAQGLAGTGVPAGAEFLPQVGDRLFWDEGFISDVGQTSAQFQTDHPNGYADFGALVMQINGNQMTDNCHHHFTVTWKSPEDGQGLGLDRKAVLDAINDNLTSLATLAATPQPWNTAQLLTLIDSKLATVTIDWVQHNTQRRAARTVVAGTPGAREPLLNPLDQMIEEQLPVGQFQVYTCSQPVLDSTMADAMNGLYTETTNNAAFTIANGLGTSTAVPIHGARFMNAHTSAPITRGKLSYRRCIWQVEVSLLAIYRREYFTGPYYFRPGQATEKFTDVDTNGHPLPSTFPLTAEGYLAPGEGPQGFADRLDQEPINYAGLVPNTIPPVTP